ncbi:uncharacterized protein K460DRAFT_401368 [Cucurbitaria berberidis CBS 394.84]|uniref:Uncharacterized protein n=1 Tax=Cucurbitaria berberidis CBS 394.84 TaxID=1168544 RepID=A0A9P4GTA3_9PLEO|nr:uncharacterized protein K460DRAFT_401368 [Cucurbitaria berberidis CBS 394.84]KAF1851340.1 hypothetical protein K460DRAFT_401368 [Cucurbitaria berberidis CBS 394.84]
MAPNSCEHQIPQEFVEVLHDEALICPVCLIKYRIVEVKNMQAGLEQRGGIFASRSKSANAPWGSRQRMSHTGWMKLWREVKMRVYDDVVRLKKLKDENPDQAVEWGIVTALAIWEQAEEACSQVPGYNYITDEDSEDEVGREQGFKELKTGAHCVEGAKSRKEAAEEDEWKIVGPKQKRRQPHNAIAPPSNVGPRGAVTVEPSRHYDRLEISTSNQFDVLSEVGVKNDRLGVAGHHGKKTVISAGLALQLGAEASKALLEEIPLTPMPAVRKSSTALPPVSTPRSALKRATPTSQLATVQPQRGTAFKPLVTVLSNSDIPSDNSTNPILQPHNEHTLAEQAKKHSTYNRRSKLYNPTTWASPEGYEKTNTSHFRTSWSIYERIHRVDYHEKAVTTSPNGEEEAGATGEKPLNRKIKPLVSEKTPKGPDRKPLASKKMLPVFVNGNKETIWRYGPPGARSGTTNGIGERESEK